CTATLTGHAGPVLSVAIAPDGSWLAIVSAYGAVRLWDRATGTSTTTFTGHTDRLKAVAIAPDGTWLATAEDNAGTVRLWDRATGACTATLTGHTDRVEAVAIAPDGTWLATASSDRTVRIWNAAGGGLAAMVGAEGELYSCAWGAARELAVGGERGLYLFKLLT
ncbi:WD40 repeat domain-containing protein, partial [Streptomyces sp. NPDC020801]